MIDFLFSKKVYGFNEVPQSSPPEIFAIAYSAKDKNETDIPMDSKDKGIPPFSQPELLFTRSRSSLSNVEDSNRVEQEAKSSRYNREQWVTLLTLAFGNFCTGACVSLQAPFFPKEAELKGATSTEYGLIFGFYQLTVFVMSPVVGKLMSFVQPKLMLNSGIFCLGVTCICFGLLDYVYGRTVFVALAFVIRILEGIGAAALRISCYSIIAAQFSGSMATSFALLEAFFGFGLITGPTVGGALYDAGGYGLPFYVIGSLVLVDALLLFFVLPNPERKENETRGDLKKFWLSPTTFIYASIVFTTFNYIGLNSATLEPHVRQFGLSGVYLGMLFALSGTMYAITAPLWGWLCDKRVENKLLCIIGCCIMIVSLMLIGPMPFLGLERNIGITIAALALMGIGCGLKLVPTFSGAMKETVARGFSADLSTYGLISSMFLSSQSLGAFVGPSLGGYFLDTIGYDYGVFLVSSAEAILTVVLISYTVVKSRKKKEKQPLFENGVKHNSYG